jgi:hypothetical protein
MEMEAQTHILALKAYIYIRGTCTTILRTNPNKERKKQEELKWQWLVQLPPG